MSLEKNTAEPLVSCPLCGKEIEEHICYEIGMVAEAIFPQSELPVGMVMTEQDREKCLECEKHIYD